MTKKRKSYNNNSSSSKSNSNSDIKKIKKNDIDINRNDDNIDDNTNNVNINNDINKNDNMIIKLEDVTVNNNINDNDNNDKKKKLKPWKIRPSNDEGIEVPSSNRHYRYLDGVKVLDVIVGKGIEPKPGSEIRLAYTALFPDGTVFDERLSLSLSLSIKSLL